MYIEHMNEFDEVVIMDDSEWHGLLGIIKHVYSDFADIMCNKFPDRVYRAYRENKVYRTR